MMNAEELEYANKQDDNMRDLMNANRSKDDAIRASYTDNYELGKKLEDAEARSKAAEARAADLAEANRENDEAITTLRAERDDQATRIIELEATAAAYKIGNDELKRIIETLRTERNEAWSSLKDARDTIQDLTP